MMTGDLEPAEREQRNEIAHMKRVGRWIEPGVDSDGTFGEALRQRVEVGAVRVKSRIVMRAGQLTRRRSFGAKQYSWWQLKRLLRRCVLLVHAPIICV